MSDVFGSLLTRGFLSDAQRIAHYGKHSKHFGASNDIEYERLADQFLGGSAPAGAFECTRKKGDLVRYNPTTNELGVLSKGRVIHTYFKPKFCSDATPQEIARKECHREKTHLDYVKKLCHQH